MSVTYWSKAALRRVRIGVALAALMAPLAFGGAAWAAQRQQLTAADAAQYKAAFAAAERGGWVEAFRLAGQARHPLLAKVLRWDALTRETSDAEYGEFIGFMKAHPDWPGQATLRKNAERTMPSSLSAQQVREYFLAHPPITVNGAARYASALLALGNQEQAVQLVRRTWVENNFGGVEEADFRAKFGAHLRPADHQARMERLLWDGEDAQVTRMLPLVDPGRRLVAQARRALANQAKNAEALYDRVPRELRADPGLQFERLRFKRRKDKDDEAVALLEKAPRELGDPAAWWGERHILVRRMIEKGDWKGAYRLARTHGLTEGATFAEAEFVTGFIALKGLGDAKTAFAHFERLYKGVSLPISLSRGAFWAGRAAERMGDQKIARKWYETAAVHGATFYGQQAALKLGRKPGALNDPPITVEAENAFEQKELTQVVRFLSQIGETEMAATFLRRLASDADKPAQYALIGQLAHDLGRLDLAVFTGKQAVLDQVLLGESGYPILTGALNLNADIALVHAIIRQESSFNIKAVSTAGARGYMQLMPATAAELGRKLGIPVKTEMLTVDGQRNVLLGSTYLNQLLDRFDGAAVLAVAGYNAGPSRIPRWIETFGDPRTGKVDVIDWIELIPIGETRNYVQRVLENYVVYATRLGGKTNLVARPTQPSGEM
ncbi:MAG TPA: lytic transglycosylase domain-containing protein [Alphaproteobacteria bacterium]|nr:lytic transglycosylase domain-containing protein [Alphaproteobacteria bacterium]